MPLEETMTNAPSNPYFATVAEQWDEIRLAYFTEHMRDAAIDKAQLPPKAIVADVGAGTGFVAAGLASRADRVIGFDASPDMLAVARRNLAEFNNVEFREAAGDQLPVSSEMFDGVFANMYRITRPIRLATIKKWHGPQTGGVLCITDLDTHDREWQLEQIRLICGWVSSEMIFAAGSRKRACTIDVDCAEGTCNACGPDGEVKPLSIFVAIGRK
jgi:ubiquinone/menaquinone biosynthesis C-methylase UbiE